MTDEPLIYTTRGNVPLSTLNPPEVRWEINDDFVKLVETHTAKDTGEIVKQGAWVFMRKPAEALGHAAKF